MCVLASGARCTSLARKRRRATARRHLHDQVYVVCTAACCFMPSAADAAVAAAAGEAAGNANADCPCCVCGGRTVTLCLCANTRRSRVVAVGVHTNKFRVLTTPLHDVRMLSSTVRGARFADAGAGAVAAVHARVSRCTRLYTLERVLFEIRPPRTRARASSFNALSSRRIIVAIVATVAKCFECTLLMCARCVRRGRVTRRRYVRQSSQPRGVLTFRYT